LRQWAAARDFLFLGRSRCCSGGAQNNDSGQRKYRPDQHFRLLVRSGGLAALPSPQTPAASGPSINHEPPAMDQGRQPCNDFKGRSGPCIAAKRGATRSVQCQTSQCRRRSVRRNALQCYYTASWLANLEDEMRAIVSAAALCALIGTP